MKSIKPSLVEIYQLILESRESENQAKNVLKRINPEYTHVDKVVEKLKQIDTSQNQKNLPAMAFFYFTEGMQGFKDMKYYFDLYNNLLANNRIQPLQTSRGGLQIGNQNLTTLQEFKDMVTQIQNVHPSQEEDDDIEIEVPDSDPIFANEKVEIYDATDVGQCIKYTVGQGLTDKTYNFCIGQKRNNRHQSYRDVGVSTFYYILDKTRDVESDPLHLVVYDHQDRKVELTDENNTSGKIEEFGTDVEAYQEYLKYLGVPVDDLLVHKPHSSQERIDAQRLGKPNNNLDWFKSLDYSEKKRYLGRGHLLTDEQFDFLMSHKSYELLQLYCDGSAKLNIHQIAQLNNNLKSTYFRRRFQEFEAFRHHFDLEAYEMKFLTRKLFASYVESGFKYKYWELNGTTLSELPVEYQVDYWKEYFKRDTHVTKGTIKKMPVEVQKVYAEVKAKSDGLSMEYLTLLNDEAIDVFYRTKARVGGQIWDLAILNNMPEQYRIEFYNTVLNQDYNFAIEEIEWMPEKLKFRVWQYIIEKNGFIPKSQLLELPHQLQKMFIEKQIESGEVDEYMVDGLPSDIQELFYEYAIENDKFFFYNNLEDLSIDLQKKYWVKQVKDGKILSNYKISSFKPEVAEAVYAAKIDKGEYFSDEEIASFSPKLRLYYFEKAIENSEYLPEEILKELPENLLFKYYESHLDSGNNIYLDEKQLIKLPKNLIGKYLDNKIKNDSFLFDYEKELLTKKQELQVEIKKVINGSYFEDDVYEKVPLKYRRIHIQNLLNDDIGLGDEEFRDASDKQKWDFLKSVIDSGKRIRRYEELLSDQLKEKISEYIKLKN